MILSKSVHFLNAMSTLPQCLLLLDIMPALESCLTAWMTLEIHNRMLCDCPWMVPFFVHCFFVINFHGSFSSPKVCQHVLDRHIDKTHYFIFQFFDPQSFFLLLNHCLDFIELCNTSFIIFDLFLMNQLSLLSCCWIHLNSGWIVTQMSWDAEGVIWQHFIIFGIGEDDFCMAMLSLSK